MKNSSNNFLTTKYLSEKEAEDQRKWVVIDAANQSVGRVATQIAIILRGKNKPNYTPNQMVGDGVIVINAAQAVFTGNKLEQKVYSDYSGYIGGLIQQTAGNLMKKDPTEVMYRAIQGMIPVTPLGFKIMKKLRIYPGAQHKQKAQVSKAA